MAEQIISASGTQYGMIVNPDGSINTAGAFSATVGGSISLYDASGNKAYFSTEGAFPISGNVVVTNIYPGSAVYNFPQLQPGGWKVNATYSSSQSGAEIKAAPGAGSTLYISDLIISNGSVNGIFQLEEAAGSTILLGPMFFTSRGGIAKSFATPIQLTSNKNLTHTTNNVGSYSIFVAGYILI